MTSLRHILLALVTLTALGTSPSVRASSPDAWAVQRAEVVAKCKQASGLKRIGISNGLWKPVGSPTDAWVADSRRPGRLGTGICTVVLS